MRDDQIRGLLHTLEEDRVPDPVFPDDLHRQLTAEERHAPRRWRLVLLAAAAVLALAGGAALGSGLLDMPKTAEASPTPSASGGVRPTTTADPAGSPPAPPPSATPSAQQTPVESAPAPSTTPPDLPPPTDILPPGSVAEVTADGLRVREDATISSDVVATVNAGDLLYLERSNRSLGPTSSDGFEWYRIVHEPGFDSWPLTPPDSPGGLASVMGWVAAESATERFVRLLPTECPGPAVDMRMVVELTPYERSACFGGRELTLEGTFGCPYCDSLLNQGIWEPG